MCVGDVTFISSDVSDELGQQLVSGASLQVDACDNEYCSCPGEETDGQNCLENVVKCDKNGELTLNITCDTEAVKQYGEQQLRWKFILVLLIFYFVE